MTIKFDGNLEYSYPVNRTDIGEDQETDTGHAGNKPLIYKALSFADADFKLIDSPCCAACSDREEKARAPWPNFNDFLRRAEQARKEGKTHKIWVSSGALNGREDHARAAHQIVPIDEPFKVGDLEMMYPGDPRGGGEHNNYCGCSVKFLVGDQPCDIIEAELGDNYTSTCRARRRQKELDRELQEEIFEIRLESQQSIRDAVDDAIGRAMGSKHWADYLIQGLTALIEIRQADREFLKRLRTRAKEIKDEQEALEQELKRLNEHYLYWFRKSEDNGCVLDPDIRGRNCRD